MQNKTNNILRWIVLLPLCVGAYIAIFFFTNLIFKFSGRDENGSYPITSLLAAGIASGIAGYVFVILGTAVAPDNKKIASLILMILMIGFSFIGVYILITQKVELDLILNTIGKPIGAVAAYIQVLKEQEE